MTKSEKQLISALKKAGKIDLAKILSETGLPNRKNENYHYSDLKMLIDEIAPIAKGAKSIGAPALRIPGSYRILIVNGEVQISTTPPAGVIVSTAKGGVIEPKNDIIAQLNSALTVETLNIDLQSSVDAIIHIDRRYEGDAAHINDGVELNILENSSAVIIETFSGSNKKHFINSASKITLEKNANASHFMVDLTGDKTSILKTISYDIAEKSLLHSLNIQIGASLSRTQIFGKFNGEKAHADFAGLMLANKNQHLDITLDVRHNVPNTTSSENFKSVVAQNSKAIFQGKIVVARDAQKTDAKMMHQGLMLSDDAQILTKPELEIFADDVICGHGATCGELDEVSLFYLMSRGIEREQAKSILIKAFLAEMFDNIKSAELHEALTSVTDDWLANNEL